MKIITLSILILLVTACASQQTQKYTDMPDEELATLFQQALTERPAPYCKKLQPIANEISRRDLSNHDKLAASYYANIQCAISEGRMYYAHEKIVEYERKLGKSTGGLGFRVAYAANKPGDAMNRLEAMSRSVDPSDFLGIDPRLFWNFFHRLALYKGHNFQKKVVNIMVQSPHFNKVQVDVRSGLATRKLKFDIEEGNLEEIDKWIPYISSPKLYLELLADRKYEVVWSELEHAVGANFSNTTNKYLSELSAIYKNQPSDIVAYQAVVDAIFYAGYLEEAVAIVATPSKADMALISEDEAWILNRKINALDALGRHAEATALFDNLATIPVSKGNDGWLINFTINRAARLSGYGEWEKAYDAIMYAENFKGSAFAKMIISRVKTCALANQGKNVSSLLDELYKNREDSYVNAAMGMICGGQQELAAKVLIEALDHEKGRSALLESIQEPKVSFDVIRPKIPYLRDLLSSQEEFREAFEKEARLIPDRFIPMVQINKL